MHIALFQRCLQPIFGEFESDEFAKFLRLGLVFTLIIGSFWTLGTLKNATFCSLVSAAHIPIAKTITLVFMVPLLSIYNRLLDFLKREHMFYALCWLFALGTLIFALLLMNPVIGQASAEVIADRSGFASWATHLLGYSWFLFVESYGLFIIALFWAIASDTTQPDSARQGFYLITAVGQLGGIIAPWGINRLPRLFGCQTNGLAVALCSIIIMLCLIAMKQFFLKTPKHLLIPYRGINEDEMEALQEPGFLEGIKLLGRTHYLLAIFCIISFFEIIMAIFDFHFQVIAAANYSGTHLAEFQGMYGSLVNLATFLCLVGGSSNITKYLGIRLALCIMPCVMIIALCGFISLNSLLFLTLLMIGCKAMNYGVNGPAIKQLYIPTTHDVRFKAQAWIEAFGYHGSKQGGSVFNLLMKPLQNNYGMVLGRMKHIMYSTYLSLALIGCWFVLSWYLGSKYAKTIKRNEVIC